MQNYLALARVCADILIDNARIDGLFAGQLNALTRKPPECTAEDPGMNAGNPEIAGNGPHCGNLMFDLSLLDALRMLTALTGDGKYAGSADEYLRSYFKKCLHPVSGYFAWGEHVGYDVVEKYIICGSYKGMHEIKGNLVPWDLFYGISPEAVENEIGKAFRNHICDENTFAFNRHAPMDGTSNIGAGPCSIGDSGGLYMHAWFWLYAKTGDARYLEDALKMEKHFRDKRDPGTGLFCTSEDRPDEMWYADALTFSVFLLASAAIEGLPDAIRTMLYGHGMMYLKSYFKIMYDADHDLFYDTVNIRTGQPVIGLSKHCPPDPSPEYVKAYTRPARLYAFENIENSSKLTQIAVSAAAAYRFAPEPVVRELFDRAVALLEVRKAVRDEKPIFSGDGGGLILALVQMGEAGLAATLADYLCEKNIENGLIVSGVPGSMQYYSNRSGSGILLSGLLALAAAEKDLQVPTVRDLYGIMPW